MNRTNLTRRAALAATGTAIASTALGAAIVPAVRAAALDSTDAALIDLAAKLPALTAEREAAIADYAACIERLTPTWPLVPDAISYKASATDWCRSDKERDLEGRVLLRDGEPHGRVPMKAADYQEGIDVVRNALRRRGKQANRPLTIHTAVASCSTTTLDAWAVEVDEMADLKAVAEKYEAQTKHIRDQVTAHKGRIETANSALFALIGLTMEAQPQTLAGVQAQAQAMVELGKVPARDRVLQHFDKDWQSVFAASILRVITA